MKGGPSQMLTGNLIRSAFCYMKIKDPHRKGEGPCD